MFFRSHNPSITRFVKAAARESAGVSMVFLFLKQARWGLRRRFNRTVGRSEIVPAERTVIDRDKPGSGPHKTSITSFFIINR